MKINDIFSVTDDGYHSEKVNPGQRNGNVILRQTCWMSGGTKVIDECNVKNVLVWIIMSLELIRENFL